MLIGSFAMLIGSFSMLIGSFAMLIGSFSMLIGSLFLKMVETILDLRWLTIAHGLNRGL
jgi:hypothetical protein